MTTPESSLAAFYLRPNQPHKSEVTAEHGHVYQKELFFYLCLVLNNWEECRYWTIGFEVTDLKKFDDIVAEFEVNNEEYSFFIQTKHAAHADKKVTRDHIIPQPGIQQKNKSQEKSFEINQYYEAVVKSKKSPNRTSKFIVLTNSEIDLDETQSTDILTIVDESNAVYCELFRELKDRCERDMKVIKFAKEIPLSGGAKITDAFFLDNFSYISKFPSSQELMIINNVLLSRKYRNFPTKNFFKVRNNVFESLSLEKDSEGKLVRNPMIKEKFNEIIQNSVLELDFPTFSADFCKQFDWIDFSEDALQCVNEGQKEFFCRGSGKLLAFMVYKAILAKERKQNRLANVFCIPFSKLTDYKDALKVFKQKVVVYVDTEEVQEEFDAYENAIFIFKSTDNNSAAKICSLDDFSNEAREEFLQKEVEFQGCPVKVSLLTDNKDVLTEILQAFFDNNQQTLKFGTKLPVDDLPKYYIDRIFSISPRSVGKLREDDMVKEEDIYTPGENTIIQGLAGVGKSTTMLRIAQRTKQQKPCRFVQYIDLKTHSDILHFIKDKGIKISSTDAWEFTKINFLKINAESEKVHRIERLLVEAYLEEELPKIVIFLDGFDEISPLYSDQIIEIVEGLKLKKIQMFISSQKHLIQTIDKLKFELNYILEPYNNVMQRQFLRLYWGNILNTMIRRGELSEDEVEKQNIHVYTKKFFKMCYRSKLTDITPSIPLMLNILADHYAQECMEFCKRSNKKWSEKILEVDVLMIYDKIFQDNCRKFYRKTEEKQSNIFIKEKEVDVFAMVRQTHMEIAAKNLLPEFWKETENVNIERRMYEIYGRGFITGNKTGEYLFIYDTFKEFFAADWFTRKIFPADKIVDIELLKCLLKKDDKNGSQKMQFDRSLTSFIYRFILKRLQDVKEKVKLEEHQAEANQISDFILEFFHYAWFNREISQLEIVFDMAKTFCPNDKVRQICKSKKLLETIPFTSPLQLELTVKIYDHYLGPEETNAVFKERDMGKILNFIIKETNFQLFKEYTDLLISRKIVTHADNLPEKTFNHFRNYLRKQKVSSWMFVKKVLLWHYELLGTTEDDIFTLLDEVLKEEQFKDRLFLGHSLASFWDWKENDQNFMKTVCSRANASKEHYRFLYALNSITREDIFEGAMQMLKDEKCSFICHDGKSVLCHAFESNNSFIVEKLLNLLTKEEIEAQIKDEVCGGNSILKQCTKENHLCDIFITIILKIFGEETIHDFFTPIEDRKGKSLEINIKFLNTIFKKKIQVKKNLLEDCMTNLWIQVINKNAKLLHSIAKEANNVEIVKHVLNYVQKRPNGLLVAQLQAVDNDGNTPLHIAAQGNRTIFFDEVEKILPEWLLSELLYIRNKDKKDVFDCIYDNKDNPMSGEEYFQKYGVHKVSNSMELM